MTLGDMGCKIAMLIKRPDRSVYETFCTENPSQNFDQLIAEYAQEDKQLKEEFDVRNVEVCRNTYVSQMFGVKMF